MFAPRRPAATQLKSQGPTGSRVLAGRRMDFGRPGSTASSQLEAGHEAGCSCSACASQCDAPESRRGTFEGSYLPTTSPSTTRALPVQRQPIQRQCGHPSCTDPNCHDINNHGGAFAPFQPQQQQQQQQQPVVPPLQLPPPVLPSQPSSSSSGNEVRAHSPGGTLYRQRSPTGRYSQATRRHAGGYDNPSHSHGNMLPLWERAAQSPIPPSARQNQTALRRHLMSPSRHFLATNPDRTSQMIIQGHGQGVLGHDEDAAANFNRIGHTQPRSDNMHHNRQTNTYHGIEDRQSSNASGSQTVRYASPRPDRASHPSYWNRNHPQFQGGPWHSWEPVPQQQQQQPVLPPFHQLFPQQQQQQQQQQPVLPPFHQLFPQQQQQQQDDDDMDTNP